MNSNENNKVFEEAEIVQGPGARARGFAQNYAQQKSADFVQSGIQMTKGKIFLAVLWPVTVFVLLTAGSISLFLWVLSTFLEPQTVTVIGYIIVGLIGYSVFRMIRFIKRFFTVLK